jgi:hypothetical protein
LPNGFAAAGTLPLECLPRYGDSICDADKSEGKQCGCWNPIGSELVA